MTVKQVSVIKKRLDKESALTPREELQSISALAAKIREYDVLIAECKRQHGADNESFYNYVAMRREVVGEHRYQSKVRRCKRAALRECVSSVLSFGMDDDRARFIADLTVDLEVQK